MAVKRKPRKLTLDTLADPRDTVEIDGEEYEIKLPGELSLGDHEELGRVMDLWQSLPEDDEERLKASIRLTYRMLVVAFHSPMPREVLDKLTPGQIGQLGDFLSERWVGAPEPARTPNPVRCSAR